MSGYEQLRLGFENQGRCGAAMLITPFLDLLRCHVLWVALRLGSARTTIRTA